MKLINSLDKGMKFFRLTIRQTYFTRLFAPNVKAEKR